MMAKSKKVFIVLISLNLLVLILIGLVVTLIYNNYKSALDLRTRSMDEIAKVSDLAALKQIVEDTSDERQYIESLFVDKERVIDFLDFIESLGGLSGAEVKVVSVDEGSLDSPTNYTTINFEAVGSWVEVFKTVSLVDYLSTALAVSKLEISKNRVVTSKEGKDPTLEWSATINVKVLKLHI